jgi:hypothetical protein
LRLFVFLAQKNEKRGSTVMIIAPTGTDRHQIPFISLVPFLLIVFGLAWGIVALFILLPKQMAEVFGELTGQHPLFYLAVYAPAIAAFIGAAHWFGMPF